MPKHRYNQTKVSKPRKPTVTDKKIKEGIIEFLEAKQPGPLTSYWEVKRAAEVHVKYYLKFKKDSMNAEMFTGISIDKMHDILREMESEGTIGWAMEHNTKWGNHYYLVSHRKADPSMSATWIFSEYEDGVQTHYRDNRRCA